MEIPDNVHAGLVAESVGAQTFIMTEIKGNVLNTNNLTRIESTRKFRETGSIESRAVDKVLQLPK